MLLKLILPKGKKQLTAQAEDYTIEAYVVKNV